MKRYAPTLRQLRYLVALRELGHFGRAAAAEGVTQSTLSAGLAELERLIGATLVERTRRSVRLTALGEAIAARAMRVLDDVDALADLAKAAAAPLSGPLALGVIPTVAPFILPRLLPRLAEHWPRLQLSVRESATRDLLDSLERGALDVGLIALPHDCRALTTLELADDPLVVVAPPGAGRNADGLPDRELLVLEDGHCLKDHVLAACRVSAEQAPVVATSLATLVALVEAGLGYTLVPEISVAAGLLAGRAVEVRPAGEADAVRRLALVFRPGSRRDEEFALLGESVVAALGA